MSSSILRRLSRRPKSTQYSDQPSGHINAAPDIAWERIGSEEGGAQTLLLELEQMYWDGVKNELEVILLALKQWQEAEYSSVSLEDESDDFVHGFDTFIDQVSQESRAFAHRYAKMKGNWKPHEEKSYLNALCDQIENVAAERITSSIKLDVRDRIECDGLSTDRLERRARMLLQSASFLDMEKVIEHQPPPNKRVSWKRPGSPQLILDGYSKRWIPTFSPLRCSACDNPIRGSMFYEPGKASNASKHSECLCEDCYRSHHYGDDSYVKAYKHCVLSKSIDSAASRHICRCPEISHFDDRGNARDIFPMSEGDLHIDVSGPGSLQCGLLKLGEHIAEAKYDGMEGKFAQQKQSHKLSDLERKTAEIQRKKQRKEEKVRNKPRNIRARNWAELESAALGTPTNGSATESNGKEAQEEIPFFLGRHTEKYPFGNVHMALRIGPLIVENGVARAKGGALISTRDSPNLQLKREATSTRSLALSSDGSARTLWSQTRPAEKPKHYMAMMKQVVGVPFSGLYKPELENEIIRDLVSASKRGFDGLDLPSKEQRRVLDEALQQLLEKIIDLMGSQVKVYLTSIASRLLDPSVNLGWDATKNNCQDFCDALIDKSLFGALVDQNRSPINSEKGITPPLYLMSFVCRPAGYMKRLIKSKFDVPKGLTEEYLLKYQYGRHDDSDILDTLQEYWYDWGAFNKPLYPFQDLFPWDCTEAYGKYPVKCGDCNIAKHVWAFPFDSWSMISLHLARDRYMYAPTTAPGAIPQNLSDQEWMRNRLTVLTAQSALIRAATAMAQSQMFRATTKWLHTQPDPHLDRLKLGGIHRAQPFSHCFEHGAYHRYFIADWAHLKCEDQIAAYERLRNGRMKMPDFEGSKAGGSGPGGSGPSGYDGQSFWDDSTRNRSYQPSFGTNRAEVSFYVEVGTKDAGFADSTGAPGCGSNCGAAGCGSSCGGAGGGGCGGGGSGGGGGGGGGGCGGGGGGGGGDGGGGGGGC